MAKFTSEEKLQTIKRYLEGNIGCNTIAKEIKKIVRLQIQFKLKLSRTIYPLVIGRQSMKELPLLKVI